MSENKCWYFVNDTGVEIEVKSVNLDQTGLVCVELEPFDVKKGEEGIIKMKIPLLIQSTKGRGIG